MKRLTAATLLALSLAFTSLAAVQSRPVTNEDVIRMLAKGVPESAILNVIATGSPAFDISPDGIIALSSANVNERIVNAVIEAQKKASAPPAAREPGAAIPVPAEASKAAVSKPESATAAESTNAEAWPSELAGLTREPGIYYKLEGKFVPIYGKPIVATNTGGFLKTSLTLGISKIRMRGQLPGKHAQLQVTDRHPIFYFYMPEGQTPDGFTLVRMDTKDDRRQFEVGSAGGITGSRTSGLDMGKLSPIVIERVAARLYRVMPDGELDDGEFGFLGTFTLTTVGVAGSGEKVYDFGVPKKR
jgi:hypothetical protein